MKTFIFTALAVLLMAACNTKTENSDKAGTSDLPYTLEEAYKDWQPGSQENTATVLKMLKAWETKNLTECATYFADTSSLSFDLVILEKISQDSLAAFLAGSWVNMASVKISLQDYESVISKDKKDQWVTVWYKQVMTDTTGKMDSLNIIDDAKFEDGKITVFNEYIQRFPAPAAAKKE